MSANMPGRIDVMPDSFHGVLVGGIKFFVTDAVRREIEHFTAGRDAHVNQLTVDTILGEELTIPHRRDVKVLWSSTPATRDAERVLDQQIEAEDPQGMA